MPTYSTRAKNLGSTPKLVNSPSSKALADEAVNQKLEDAIGRITQNVVDKVKDIIAAEISKSILEIEQIFNQQVTELKREIHDIKETHAKDVDTLKQEVVMLKSKIAKQENAAIASEIRIVGIPIVENENLLELLNTLCTTLKIPMPEVLEMKRLRGNSNNALKTDPPIIVKLSNPQCKNEFLRNIAVFKRSTNDNLRLKYMGFSSDTAFYINEQLTRANHNILKSATRMKKSKQLWSVFTRRGMIYVKQQQLGAATCILSTEQLNDFLTGSDGSPSSSNGFRGLKQ